MGNRDNVKLWYCIGMANDSVVHVEHDVFGNDEKGKSQARKMGQQWFDRGEMIEGQLVEFDRVTVISEYHETALDMRKRKG
jgi:hypothetical protein